MGYGALAAAIMAFGLFMILAIGVYYLVTFVRRVLRFIAGCVLIHKGEGNWWKGLIPFYNKWVTYHLAFNHKTAVVIFIVDCVTFVLLCISYGVSRAVSDAGDTLTSTGTSGAGSLDTFFAALGVIGIVCGLISMVLALIYTLIYRFSTSALCKAFGHETGFCVAAFFFPVITSSIVAFGSSEYMDDVTEIIPEY